MGRYLEIARRVIAEQDAQKAEGAPVAVESASEPTQHDPYAERFLALIDRLRADPLPPEGGSWTAQNHAALYRLMTVVLLDKLAELWDKHAPVGAFQFILDRIEDAHRAARKLYAAHLVGQTEPPCDPKTCKHVFRTPRTGGGSR
jgi:hypothetical protein